MAKIGVYIPDAKKPEIEKWRKTLNFSELFMEAFGQAVKREEMSDIGDDKVKSVIQRLKSELDDDYAIGNDGAFECGVEWAEDHLSLADFRRVCEDGVDGETLCNEILGESSLVQNLDGRISDGHHDREMYLNGFASGFAEGATSIWSQVKDQL